MCCTNGKIFSLFYDFEPWSEKWDAKVKVLCMLRYENQLVMTSAILISKVQPCPISSGIVQGT